MSTASKLWMPGPQDRILQHLLKPKAGPEGGRYQKLPHRALFVTTQDSQITNMDTGPGAKLSYRSAILEKVRFFAGFVWPWPQGQADVGRDQEHPGNTSHGPNKLKFGQTYYF